jgi:hypothetical protein
MAPRPAGRFRAKTMHFCRSNAGFNAVTQKISGNITSNDLIMATKPA